VPATLRLAGGLGPGARARRRRAAGCAPAKLPPPAGSRARPSRAPPLPDRPRASDGMARARRSWSRCAWTPTAGRRARAMRAWPGRAATARRSSASWMRTARPRPTGPPPWSARSARGPASSAAARSRPARAPPSVRPRRVQGRVGLGYSPTSQHGAAVQRRLLAGARCCCALKRSVFTQPGSPACLRCSDVSQASGGASIQCMGHPHIPASLCPHACKCCGTVSAP